MQGAAKCPPHGFLTPLELAFQSVCTEVFSRAQDVMSASKDRKSYVYARTVHDSVSNWRSELRDLTKLQPIPVVLKLLQSALQYVVAVKEKLNGCVDKAVLEYLRWKQVIYLCRYGYRELHRQVDATCLIQRIVVEFATFVSSAKQEDRNYEDVQNAVRDCLRGFIELEAAIKQAAIIDGSYSPGQQAQEGFQGLLDYRSRVWMETVSLLRGLVNSWLRGKNASARYTVCCAAADFLSRKKAAFHELHAQDAAVYQKKLADAEALAAALIEEENISKHKAEKSHKKQHKKLQTAEPPISVESAEPDYILTTPHMSEMSARISEESEEQPVCDKQATTLLSKSMQLLACPLTKVSPVGHQEYLSCFLLTYCHGVCRRSLKIPSFLPMVTRMSGKQLRCGCVSIIIPKSPEPS